MPGLLREEGPTVTVVRDSDFADSETLPETRRNPGPAWQGANLVIRVLQPRVSKGKSPRKFASVHVVCKLPTAGGLRGEGHGKPSPGSPPLRLSPGVGKEGNVGKAAPSLQTHTQPRLGSYRAGHRGQAVRSGTRPRREVAGGDLDAVPGESQFPPRAFPANNSQPLEACRPRALPVPAGGGGDTQGESIPHDRDTGAQDSWKSGRAWQRASAAGWPGPGARAIPRPPARALAPRPARVLTGQRRPGLPSCRAVSRAWRRPPQAGLRSSGPAPEGAVSPTRRLPGSLHPGRAELAEAVGRGASGRARLARASGARREGQGRVGA